MKKYLLIFILIFSSVAFAGWQDDLIGVIAQKNATPVCVKDTGTLIYNQTSSTGSWALEDGVQAAGQNVTAASFQLYSIKLYFNDNSGCSVTVRAGTTADLSTYVEEWANVAIGDGLADYEFISATNDTYTNLYWGVIEYGGACKPRYSTGDPVTPGSDFQYGDTGGVDWDISGYVYTDGRDITSEVFKCE